MLNDIPALVIVQHMQACNNDLEWLTKDMSPKEAWEKCPKPEQLLWLCLEMSTHGWGGLQAYGDFKERAALAGCDMLSLGMQFIHAPELTKLVRSTMDATKPWTPQTGSALWGMGQLLENYLQGSAYGRHFADGHMGRAALNLAYGTPERIVHGVCMALRISCGASSAEAAVEQLERQCLGLVHKHLPWDLVEKALEAFVQCHRLTKTGAAPLRSLKNEDRA